MKATVYNIKGVEVKEVDLDPAIFSVKVKPELVQQAVVVSQANKRQVLAHAKDRSEVAGGGRKPWRQKGTGRARHGSNRSPIWRGGGITFGPTRSRNFSLKINKKAKRKALLMSLSDKAANGKIILLDKLELEEAKTKKFFEILRNLKLREKKEETKKSASADAKVLADKKASSFTKVSEDKSAGKQENEKAEKAKKSKEKSILLVLPKKNEKAQRAARNIPRLTTVPANSLNILDILKQQYLLLPVDSLDVIKKTFKSASAKAPASVKTSAGRSADKK